MTIPDETQFAHCGECQHRYGAGCGCECCAWAGEAVKAAAEALASEDARNWGYDHGFEAMGDAETEAFAREAVQAALPVIRGAAVAAERDRLRAILGRFREVITQPNGYRADIVAWTHVLAVLGPQSEMFTVPEGGGDGR